MKVLHRVHQRVTLGKPQTLRLAQEITRDHRSKSPKMNRHLLDLWRTNFNQHQSTILKWPCAMSGQETAHSRLTRCKMLPEPGPDQVNVFEIYCGFAATSQQEFWWILLLVQHQRTHLLQVSSNEHGNPPLLNPSTRVHTSTMPNLRRSSGVAALLRGTFSWEGLGSKIEILEDRIWVKVKATAFQRSKSLSWVLSFTLPVPQPKTFFRLDFGDRLGLGLLLQWCWWNVENCHLELASYILRRLSLPSSFKNWQSLAKQWNKFDRSNSLANITLSSFQSERRSMKVSEKPAYDSKQPPQNWATGSKAAKPQQICDPVVSQQNDANAFVWGLVQQLQS